MTRSHLRKALACAAVFGCWAGAPLAAQPAPPAPPAPNGPVTAPPPARAAQAARPPLPSGDDHVSTTIVPGTEAYPAKAGASPPAAPIARPGPVSLNFPSVDVQAFAKAVLGDILNLPYAVDPSVHGTVSLITSQPVAKADVLPMVEDTLKISGLALEPRAGVYTIIPLATAQGQAGAIGPGQQGFGNETLTLSHANPAELKKIIDPILPGVITSADPATGVMVLSGATAQRRSARDLVQQLDLDWLKGMSFALFIPKNADARLIAPELDKLINAPGSTVAGMVRLVAMERLNGIVAISPRAQYLEDVRQWVEVLDREGQSTERRLYVYRAQNGRASDLSNVLISAFGGTPGGSGGPSGSNQRRSLTAGASGNGSIGGPSVGAASTSPTGPSLTSSSLSPGGPDSSATLPGQSSAAVAKTGGMGGGDQLVITADEANNAVVAFATPREYALIENALRQLDITPLQVVIEAAITEVTLNDTLQYGTQWYLQSHNVQVSLTQSMTSPQPAPTFPGFSTVLNNSSIAATISALSSVTHVTVLSAPNLLVLNNQTASLEVGDQVPVTTGSAVSTVASGAPLVNSVDYRNTGVILQVTPRVNSSGLVLLDISQEVSQVDNNSPASAQNPINSPVISERKIASSIAVQDGQTIALGGLISDDISKGRTGVPILSAIPILGALAGNRNNTRQRTELLILLTPRVIRNAGDAEAMTEELKRKIHSIEPLRPKFEP